MTTAHNQTILYKTDSVCRHDLYMSLAAYKQHHLLQE